MPHLLLQTNHAQGLEGAGHETPAAPPRGQKRQRGDGDVSTPLPPPARDFRAKRRPGVSGPEQDDPAWTPLSTGKCIAHKLQEPNEEALVKATRLLGVAAAWELLQETERVQAGGGLLLPSGNRRRSPGGVFFHLLKGRLDKQQLTWVFAHNKDLFKEKTRAKNRRRNARRREAAAAQPTAPPQPASASASSPPSTPAAAMPAWMAPSGRAGGAPEPSQAPPPQVDVLAQAQSSIAELDALLAEM